MRAALTGGLTTPQYHPLDNFDKLAENKFVDDILVKSRTPLQAPKERERSSEKANSRSSEKQ